MMAGRFDSFCQRHPSAALAIFIVFALLASARW